MKNKCFYIISLIILIMLVVCIVALYNIFRFLVRGFTYKPIATIRIFLYTYSNLDRVSLSPPLSLSSWLKD